MSIQQGNSSAKKSCFKLFLKNVEAEEEAWKLSRRNHKYSCVPIRRGVQNKRSGTQDEKCIVGI